VALELADAEQLGAERLLGRRPIGAMTIGSLAALGSPSRDRILLVDGTRAMHGPT